MRGLTNCQVFVIMYMHIADNVSSHHAYCLYCVLYRGTRVLFQIKYLLRIHAGYLKLKIFSATATSFIYKRLSGFTLTFRPQHTASMEGIPTIIYIFYCTLFLLFIL